MKPPQGRIEPPRPIEGAARTYWDRLAGSLFAAGRLDSVDQDMLVRYCETAELYDELLADIRREGTTVRGRSADQTVRHPGLTPLAQCRADMNRMAALIPLMDRRDGVGRLDVEAFIASLSLDEIGPDA